MKASYNISETARLLGLSRVTIYSLIQSGDLVAFNLRHSGRGQRVKHESILDYLTTHQVDPGA